MQDNCFCSGISLQLRLISFYQTPFHQRECLVVFSFSFLAQVHFFMEEPILLLTSFLTITPQPLWSGCWPYHLTETSLTIGRNNLCEMKSNGHFSVSILFDFPATFDIFDQLLQEILFSPCCPINLLSQLFFSNPLRLRLPEVMSYPIPFLFYTSAC